MSLFNIAVAAIIPVLIGLIWLLFPGTGMSRYKGTRELQGLVTEVHDGDTITVTDNNGTKYRVRLDGIDTPESNQPYGNEAKAKLIELVDQKHVRVDVSGKDRYSREIGRVFVGNTNVNAEMVKLGLAWWYSQHSKDPTLATLQEAAKQAKLGLWRSKNNIPPWQWRKNRPR